jgi:hypothetical protein
MFILLQIKASPSRASSFLALRTISFAYTWLATPYFGLLSAYEWSPAAALREHERDLNQFLSKRGAVVLVRCRCLHWDQMPCDRRSLPSK